MLDISLGVWVSNIEVQGLVSERAVVGGVFLHFSTGKNMVIYKEFLKIYKEATVIYTSHLLCII